jgi:hypothetical protein
MAEAASAQQAAKATAEDTSQQRAGRRRRTSPEPRRAQQGATAAAAPAALDSLSRLQQLADASPQGAQLRRLQALADASPQAAQLRRLQALVDASPQVAQLRRLQALADAHYAPVAQLAGAPEEEERVQGQFANAELEPQLQQAPRANNTGLPDQLKSGLESLSGLSMDHVRVHYNSAQPAQLNALAYAQGSDIHLAPGQERHLPHEAWHVVQQAQGRVRPTLQMKDGVQVNDDVGLEREADVMGWGALAASPQDVHQVQRQSTSAAGYAGMYQLCRARELIGLGRLWNAKVWMTSRENQDLDVRNQILEKVNDMTGFSVGPVFQEYDLYVRGPGPSKYKDIVKGLDESDAQQLQLFFDDGINFSNLDPKLKKLATIVCVAERGRGYPEQDFISFLDDIVTGETNFANIELEYPPSLTHSKDARHKIGEYEFIGDDLDEDYSMEVSEEEYHFFAEAEAELNEDILGRTRSGRRYKYS